MAQPKPIKTVSAQAGQPSQWYIKGSYVLDVVYADRLGDVRHAADADVYYLQTTARPTKFDVEAALAANNLPPLPVGGLDGPYRVDDLAALDGGGEPKFNIDLWHLRENGALLVRDDAGRFTPLLPDSPVANGPLRLLPGRNPDPKHALKGLMKMALYPPLYHRTLARILTKIVEAALP